MSGPKRKRNMRRKFFASLFTTLTVEFAMEIIRDLRNGKRLF